MKYKLAFNPKKGLKFQYFPLLSRREGILECPSLSSARSSGGAVSIFGVIMPFLLPFVKDKIQTGWPCISVAVRDELRFLRREFG